MAVSTFVFASTLWLLGLSYFLQRCAALEGETHPFGTIGAMVGFDWLRGSTEESRRWRGRALAWAAGGLMLLLLVTHAAVTFEV